MKLAQCERQLPLTVLEEVREPTARIYSVGGHFHPELHQGIAFHIALFRLRPLERPRRPPVFISED
jgi:hypothetical protein